MRAWNDSFFRWNGMEGFNRGVREAATQVAIKFIKRHASEPNEHSKRYLSELDLSAAEVKKAIGEDGGLNVNDPKISAAVMRWVDGAIVRPNASMRPIYGNDPHFASFFHLKQFMYATQATILKRMAHEAKNGNLDPMVTAMAGYIPVMLAADAMKGVIQTLVGGGAPMWEHQGVAGMVGYAAQRAGLTGTAQMGLDVAEYGPAGLFGPAGEQIYHMFTDPWQESVGKAVAVGPAGLALKGMAWND